MEEKTTVVSNPVTGADRIRQISASEPEEIEIDLLKLLMAFRDNILLILLLGVLFANIFAVGTRFLITPTYTSQAKMLVLSKETTISSLADLQLGSQLTKDYTILIQSRPVLNEVIENLGLNFDYETLSSKLKVTNPSDSRILELDVTDSDPYLAKRIVDEIATVSSKYIGEKMEVTTPNIIEEGVIPYRSTSPSMRKNVLLGLMLGLLLGCAIVTVEELMNDAIVTEEDVEQYLGLYTLAVLPDKEQKKNGVQRKLQKLMKKRAGKKA